MATPQLRALLDDRGARAGGAAACGPRPAPATRSQGAVLAAAVRPPLPGAAVASAAADHAVDAGKSPPAVGTASPAAEPRGVIARSAREETNPIRKEL